MKKPLHIQMLIGFAAGLGGGLLAYATVGPQADAIVWVTTNITQPIGQLFLRLVFMLILPLIFSALTVVVAEMSDMRTLGRAGLRTLALTVAGGCISVPLGMLLANMLQPGAGVDPQVVQRLIASAAEGAKALVESGTNVPGAVSLITIVPKNVIQSAARDELLPVIVFSLFLGVGFVLTRGTSTETFRKTLEGLFNVTLTLINLVIRVAPIAVACLVFNQAALFGWDLVLRLGSYVSVVLLGLVLHASVVYSLALLLLARTSPFFFFRQVQEAMLMGFATASSAATLPTMLLVAEQKLGLPKQIARFAITLGVATNKQGTALFQGVTVLFLAQFFGVHLDLSQQLAIMMVCILTSIGGAAVPAGSLPVIAAILVMYGIPAEGLGLILGVDRLLDMCRTAINVAGNLTVATIVSRWEQPALAETAQRSATTGDKSIS